MKKSFSLIVLIILHIGLASGQNDFSFVFLPDLHLRPVPAVERDFDLLEKKIESLHPDFIITGGDMIYTAKDGDEKKAKILFDFMDAELGRFTVPVYYTIGNHEAVGILPNSGIDSSHPQWGKRLFEERYGSRYKALEINGWKFFLLDGIKILEQKKNYTSGIDSVQMEWIKTELTKTDKIIPLVISIHTPLINPKAMSDSNAKALSENAENVLHLFDEYNLRIVLQGHNHLYMNLFIHGIHFISGGSTSFSPDLDAFDDGFILINIKDDRDEIQFISTEREEKRIIK